MLVAALVALGVLAAAWWPPLAIGCLALLIANVVIDDWAGLRLAHQGRAIEVLVRALASAERALARGGLRDEAIARDLAVFARLRARVRWLTVRDPFDLADLLCAGLLIRVLLVGGFLREIARERDRLRRVVLWLGELDALVSIASLRAERADALPPQLSTGARKLAARGLVHPAIAGAVGNDLVLDAGLLVTGSNMAGKSTFLRTVAVNAICAQSIHTTFGAWHASLFRVFAVMRVGDATAEGRSTYAVEVAAIGALVDAVARRDHELPALFVVDEPFHGTNPALRVPIVVSMLDYLGERDISIAATTISRSPRRSLPGSCAASSASPTTRLGSSIESYGPASRRPATRSRCSSAPGIRRRSWPRSSAGSAPMAACRACRASSQRS